MRILLQKLTMVKGLQEAACVRSAAYSNYISRTGYREAVKTLNLLQTNASVLQEVRRKRKQGLAEKNDKMLETYRYLNRSGISLEKLDALPIIHVAGTKGKGSTCAFCESILRHWGMGLKRLSRQCVREETVGTHPIRTGLYTSPHLVEVRERIQLDGKPMSQELFASYFWDVYNSLMQKREHERDMPPYFKFLTILAFNVFIKEGVDVAIVEVGIGGEYDCTNIIRKPVAVGITSLGIDHTSILGETLEEIAWQKAGILKKGAQAFTSLGQDPSALAVLKDRAEEKRVSLKVCPPLSSYCLNDHCLPSILNMHSKVQEINASLALQLANAWIKWYQNSNVNDVSCDSHNSASDLFHSEVCMAPPVLVDSLMISGLKNCKWPGRSQIFYLSNSISLDTTIPHKTLVNDISVTFFLDGAHTCESIQHCLDWFKYSTYLVESYNSAQDKITECANGTGVQGDTVRVLLFNTTGDRDVEGLLSPFAKSKLFHFALFSTNSPTSVADPYSDLTNFSVYQDQQKARCEEHMKIWLKYNEHIPAQVHSCVSDALASLHKLLSTLSITENKCRNLHILVSGSLHLIGSVLSIIDPNLSSFYPADESSKDYSKINMPATIEKCHYSRSPPGTSVQSNGCV